MGLRLRVCKGLQEQCATLMKGLLPIPDPAHCSPSQGFGIAGHCQPSRVSLCIYTEIQTLAGRGESFPVILKQTLMKPEAPAAQLPPAPLELVVTVRMRPEEDHVSGWPFTM